jgi:hypothetical protein
MKWHIWLPLLVACGGAREEPQTAALPATPATATATATAAATTSAATSEPEPLPVATQAAPSSSGVVVDRDVWMGQFELALPVALCKDGFYFRACFTVTPAECEQTASSATRVCLAKFRKQLPLKIHQPDEGTDWGSKIGSCTGTAYEAALSRHRISNAKCNDPSQWTVPP